MEEEEQNFPESSQEKVTGQAAHKAVRPVINFALFISYFTV